MTSLRPVLVLAMLMAPMALPAQDSVRAAVPGTPQVADTGRRWIGIRDTASAIMPRLIPTPRLRSPWLVGWFRTRQETLDRFDAEVAAGVDSVRRAMAYNNLLRTLVAGSVDSVGIARQRTLFGLATTTANLTLDGQLRLAISSTRQRNLSCTPALLQDPISGCRGGFSAPRIDNQLQVRSSGVIGQRVHIDVDLDTERDFSNNNLVRAYYQGLEDEVVRRVDIGSVAFRPPPSRFLTAGIPSNNFGISAEFERGPFQLQAIAATQQGSELATRTYRIGAATTEPQDRQIRDLDYESGRFFWVVDPRQIPGYPAVDILNLGSLTVPPDFRPADVRIYRYVAASAQGGVNANYDGITALGLNGTERAGPLRWRLLNPGTDYWIDPSGLWFVLAGRMDPSDYLAVSYRTQAGTFVGTFPATDNPARSDTLRLISVPNRGPSSPVFRQEMRQVYRIGGSDLVRSSLRVSILVARSERPDSGTGTWLSTLGLAIPTDPAVVDVDNRLFPRVRDPGASAVIRDALLVFPNAEPFADSTRLTRTVRNDSLYRTPGYLMFTQGPPATFAMNLHYEAAGGGDKGSLTLDAVQIKEQSEQLLLDGRRLTRGVDYTIDYNTGRVIFLNPDALFGAGVATVTARYEQKGFFAVAPTTIAGLTGTWTVGHFGAIHASGIYQAEATAFNRPPVGFEPKSSFIGGISGEFSFNTPAVSRWLQKVLPRRPGVLQAAPSALNLSGEVAWSRPDPNRSGDAFLEEFENDGGILLPMLENQWLPGSRPQSGAGVGGLGFANGFDLDDAVQLVWQNLVPNARRNGSVELSPGDIDSTIVLTNSSTRAIETALYLTFHADTAGGMVDFQSRSHWTQPRRDFRPRWRTMTTALSPTGLDLSHAVYLEFYLYEADDRPVEQSGMRFVVDIGKVSEDAVSVAPTGFTVSGSDTTWTGRQYVGRGRLDTERSSFGTWSGAADDIGILGDRPDTLTGPGGVVTGLPLCSFQLSATTTVYPWGDLGARCTRGDGFASTEDLDGDLILDAQGPDDDVVRYVVDLSDPKYFVRSQAVRDSAGRGGHWTLYRVPLDKPDATIGNPDLRLARQVRFGFVTPPDNGGADPVVRFAMARMRLTGAPWVRRTAQPILGLSGALAQPRGEVVVGSISTQNIERGYVSPPGVRNAPSTIAVGTAQFAQQVNEKSLSILASDLRNGERAEAYYRLPSGSQSLLSYRELRVWMRGRGTGWDNDQLEGYLKVGNDARNFYLYRAPARTTTWEPEMVVDLETWRSLRAEVETRIEQGQPPSGAAECGGDPEAWVACDGPYLVQVRDPLVNPPNLYAVQELAVGIYHAKDGPPVDSTELWVDDIRLTAPVTEVGVATAFSAQFVASDLATIDLNYVSQDGRFRQIGQAPSYRTTGTFSGTAQLHLERLFSPSLGISMPFTVGRVTNTVTPQLLSGSDIRADAIPGLRIPKSSATNWTMSLRRSTPSTTSRWLKLLIDPLGFSAQGAGASTQTELSTAETSSWNLTLNYFLSPARRAVRLPLEGFVKGLPRWLRESAAGQGLARGTFAPWPTSVRWGSSLSKQAGEFTSFAEPIERLSDTILKPVTSLQHLWRNNAGLTWQPFGMFQATVDWQSTRDLRRYPDSTSLGRVAGAARRGFLGADVGVERDRNLSTGITLAPRLASWLQPRFSHSTTFLLSRSLTSRNPVRVEGDTAGDYILPQTLNNSRVVEYGLTLDPAILFRHLFGEQGVVARATRQIRPIVATRTRTLQSTYDLATFNPGWGYQLALGSFDHFLSQGGQRAIGGVNAVTSSVNSAFDLPGGLSATITYSATSADRHQRQAGDGFLVYTSDRVEWPNGNLRWNAVIPSGPVSGISLSTQFQRTRTSSTIPLIGESSARALTRSSGIRPDLTVTLRNDVVLHGSASIDHTLNQSNGNLTKGSTELLTGDVTWTTRIPGIFSRKRRQMIATLTAQRANTNTCIQRVGDSTCTPFSDIRQFNVTGSVLANLRTVRAGMSFSYVLNDVRYLQRKTSTMTAALTFTIPLEFLGM